MSISPEVYAQVLRFVVVSAAFGFLLLVVGMFALLTTKQVVDEVADGLACLKPSDPDLMAVADHVSEERRP